MSNLTKPLQLAKNCANALLADTIRIRKRLDDHEWLLHQLLKHLEKLQNKEDG